MDEETVACLDIFHGSKASRVADFTFFWLANSWWCLISAFITWQSYIFQGQQNSEEKSIVKFHGSKGLNCAGSDWAAHQNPTQLGLQLCNPCKSSYTNDSENGLELACQLC
jgi:hypothetical protein